MTATTATKTALHKKLFFNATVRLQGIDRVGMLLDISQVISSQMNVNIHRLTIASEEGVFDGSVELRVHDRDDVKNIIDQLAEFHEIHKRNEFFIALGEKTVLLGEKDIDELNGKNKRAVMAISPE